MNSQNVLLSSLSFLAVNYFFVFFVRLNCDVLAPVPWKCIQGRHDKARSTVAGAGQVQWVAVDLARRMRALCCCLIRQ